MQDYILTPPDGYIEDFEIEPGIIVPREVIDGRVKNVGHVDSIIRHGRLLRQELIDAGIPKECIYFKTHNRNNNGKRDLTPELFIFLHGDNQNCLPHVITIVIYKSGEIKPHLKFFNDSDSYAVFKAFHYIYESLNNIVLPDDSEWHFSDNCSLEVKYTNSGHVNREIRLRDKSVAEIVRFYQAICCSKAYPAGPQWDEEAYLSYSPRDDAFADWWAKAKFNPEAAYQFLTGLSKLGKKETIELPVADNKEDATLENIRSRYNELYSTCEQADEAKDNVGESYRELLFGAMISKVGVSDAGEEIDQNEEYEMQKTDIPYSRNRILFGAPGTGKSYVLKQQAEEFFKPENVERVTFHPEYSYFDFVGSYKPKMEGEGEAERIKYRFVPGPFIRILKEALAHPEQNYLLVIEEINRARVAAVFGDVFQLLDRNADGASEYGISPSEELKDHLKKALKEHSKIVDIDKLQIPANLYIWATMNSADQGVYPMDTAFKRRWNFEYQGIDEGREKVSGTHADAWHSLRENINMLLQEAGVNEDKQMGPFFMSPNELNCSAADFLAAFKNKVIMYLFEDAAKHKRDQVFRAKAQGKRYSEVCTLCGKDTLNAASILRDVFGVEIANSTSEATQE